MSFIKRLFGKKDEPITNYTDFWIWFKKNERDFHHVVKSRGDIEKVFFDKLSPKLDELKAGYFYVTGMFDDHTVELILTADGNTKNVVFVEELVEHAPEIPGWKFTALKPALAIEDVTIEMGGLRFAPDNLFFYSNSLPNCPDEIDIFITHPDLNEENRKEILSGVSIFLDNYLGELDFLNTVDNLEVIGEREAAEELIPIAKLKDFLTWRQKEFVEKYESVRYDTAEDEYAMLEAQLKGGNMLVAVVNSKLLNWDAKASHPWLAVITIEYDGSKNNGMPNNHDYESMSSIENEIMNDLIDKDGYLNIGRQSASNKREIYFACKDFRKPSKVLYEIQEKYGDKFEMDYDIYKDKYWQTFDRFKQT